MSTIEEKRIYNLDSLDKYEVKNILSQLLELLNIQVIRRSKLQEDSRGIEYYTHSYRLDSPRWPQFPKEIV